MHYFFLGHTPALSILELGSLLPGPVSPVTDTVVGYDQDLDPATFGPRLGGTRKIAKQVEICPSGDTVSRLTALIAAGNTKNVAITDYADLHLTSSDLVALKKDVQQSRPLRLVSTDTAEHELVMLEKQHVAEFNLLPTGEGQVAIAQTAWIFAAADWVARDRAKPYRDIKRGMLPPKLARILVNLATRGQSGLTLADPFCGTGTILAEAMLSGCTVIGSDTNPEAVQGSQANLEWLASSYHLESKIWNLQVGDATHLPEHVKSLDCIATEPYMGPLQDDRHVLTAAKLKDIARGLDKLYRGALRCWHTLLPARGRVVMTIPSFRVGSQEILTISVDTLISLGYNYVDSVAYSKPGASVIRNITILEKK